jgi:tetratricopeptide (TPR) repeat protein
VAEVAIGRCVLYGEGRTWLPLRELVEDGGRGLAVLERFDALAAAAIRALLDGDTVPIADAFWAARRFIESLARERPALVVLDDVHWAAPTFLDFVERLAAAPAHAPVLVLCLARPELVEERPGLPSLLLRPLHAREATQLVEVAAGEDAARGARARVVELMDGNPLFAEQLLTYAREHGEDALASVPPTIEALLASRFDRLDPEARATLQRAAVAGREFRQAAVLQMSPRLEVPAAGRHLGDLAAAGIVHRVRPRADSPDGFRFHHALARDVAYASVPRAERADLHERFAEWLAAGGDAEDELLGFHLEQAYAYRRELSPNDPHAAGLALAAGNHLRAAGFRAHKRGDSPAAATLLARAASLLPARECSADDLLCELAIAEWSAQDARRAAATLERAVDVAHTERDLRAELRARIELANLRFFTGPDAMGDELLGLAQQATAVFDQYDDARSLGRTLLHVGFLHGGVRRQNEAWREAAERALDEYRRTEWSAASCIGDLAAALVSGPVPARAARARCRELLAESKDDRLARAHVLVGLGALDAMLRRFAAARSKLADARAIYEESGFTLAVVTRVERNLGRAELLARRPEEAARVFRSCCDTFERTGDRGSLATTAAELAEACFRMRQHDDAARWAAVSERAATNEDVGAQNRWRSVKAKLLAQAGCSVEARNLAQQAVALTERTDATNERADARLSLAWVYRAAGDVKGAAAAAERALRLYEEKENEAAAAQARSFLRAIALPSRV